MVSMGRALDRREAVRTPDLKLFVRDVRDRQARKRAITVRSWCTIQEVKHVIQKIMHVPPSAQRLFFGPLLSSGGELPNHRTLHDAGIYRSGETLLLDIKDKGMAASPFASLRASENDVCISSSMIDSTPKPLKSLVQKARRGFLMGLKPEFVLDGSGGTYFLHDAKKAKIAVFKPADEEPYAENNPRGYIPQAGQQPMALREGVVPGEACIREVAAFLLDHEGFSGVPMTTLTESRHPAFNNNGSRLKVAQGGASIGSHSITANGAMSSALNKKVGSFQEFVKCECTIDDISPSKLSVDEVHKIAILDIRILNADRNAANLLIRRRRDNSLELVPIDHGFCLRTVSDISWMDWCWLDWPQLKQPLSEASKKYIMGLDIEADARMLREQLNICSDAIDLFRASSRILKAGVEAGLTLYDIAIMCCRNDNLGEVPSKLEILFSMAEDLSLSALENGKWHHSAASRALADQLTPRGGTLIPARRCTMSHSSARFFKSMSHNHFAPLMDDDDSGSLEELQRDFPGMTPSSGSDSSSENGDAPVEQEDCEEWAASLLNNISMDRSMSIVKGSRSPSVGSEDDSAEGLSSSPKGFWHTRPGSPSAHSFDDDSDDESWNLSPRESLSHKVELARPSVTGFLPFPESPIQMENFRSPTVTFADDLWLDKEVELSSRPIDDPEDEPTLSPPLMPKMEGGGLKRSQSYSAVSDLNKRRGSFSLGGTNNALRYPDAGTKEYGQFRDYFLKFVDLVIVRETKAASMTQTQPLSVS